MAKRAFWLEFKVVTGPQIPPCVRALLTAWVVFVQRDKLKLRVGAAGIQGREAFLYLKYRRDRDWEHLATGRGLGVDKDPAIRNVLGRRECLLEGRNISACIVVLRLAQIARRCHGQSASRQAEFSPMSIFLLPAEGDLLALSQRKQHELGWREPTDLLTFKRFDLPAKYIYALLRQRGVADYLRDRVYAAHLKLWNRFFEASPQKTTFEDFRAGFDAVLEDTRLSRGRGLPSLVPVSMGGHPLNGAHRIAAALFFSKLVLSVTLDVHSSYSNFDYRYFRRLAEQLPDDGYDTIFDEMALCYARLKPNTRLITLFDPPAESSHIYKEISSFGDIVYDRHHYLGVQARTNLVQVLYRGEVWLGTVESKFRGAMEKAQRCFPTSGNVRFILFEPSSDQAARQLKTTVRAMLGRSNDSIHINDTHEQTNEHCAVAFHANSIEFLQIAKLGTSQRLEALLPQFHQAAQGGLDAYCIDGGGVLAAYGIRDCDDLDYLHQGPPLTTLSNINSHNEYGTLYNKPVDFMIYHPSTHFYYAGIKFLTVGWVRNWKALRDEAKDRVDLNLIARFLEGA